MHTADQSIEELARAPGAEPKQAVARLRYSHEAMIDQILANPGISQNTLAALFGYTPAWVSRIINTDAFQAMLASRRSELVDPMLVRTMEERFRGVTAQALTRLEERLEAPMVSDKTILRAVELGAKALAIGGNAPPAPPSTDDRLTRLAEKLLAIQPVKGVSYEKVVDVEVVRVSECEGTEQAAGQAADGREPAEAAVRADGAGAGAPACADGGKLGE